MRRGKGRCLRGGKARFVFGRKKEGTVKEGRDRGELIKMNKMMIVNFLERIGGMIDI